MNLPLEMPHKPDEFPTTLAPITEEVELEEDAISNIHIQTNLDLPDFDDERDTISQKSEHQKKSKFLELGILKDPLFLLICAREFTALLVIDSFYVFGIAHAWRSYISLYKFTN